MMNRKYKNAVLHIHASEALLETVLHLPDTQEKMSGIPFRRWELRAAVAALLVGVLILATLPRTDTNLLTIAVMAEGQDPQYLEYMVDNSAVLIRAMKPNLVMLSPFDPFLYYFDPISQQHLKMGEYEYWSCLYFCLEISTNGVDTSVVLEHDGQSVQAGNYKDGLALYEPVLDSETEVNKYTVWGRFATQEDITISVYHKERLIQQKVLRVIPSGEYEEYSYQIQIISNVDLR